MISLRAVVASIVFAGPLAAQAPAPSAVNSTADRAADSTAAIAAAQSVLRAISTKDPALAHDVLLPGMLFVAMNDPANATTTPRTQTDSAFVAFLGAPGAKLLERMWAPSIFLQGSVAIVHGSYDFHVDGAFSHCGVDTFTLVKANGRWRISHVAYTVQRTGCAPSPLGAPSK